MIAYPGPFSVGVCQLEVAPRSVAQYGTLAAVFYPCSTTSPKSKWALGPPGFYAAGFGRYLGVNAFLRETVFPFLVGFVRMEAAAEPDPVLAGHPSLPQQLPVVVFSHGLGGNQTVYSTLCGTLASYGFVVISIEHRDKSASVSARANYLERIDYQKPPSEDAESRVFRQKQLGQRLDEVEEAFQLLQDLNKGLKIDNLLSTKLPNLTGRLDMENAIMVGHSFGAATALGFLQRPKSPFIAGIILDPWMFALSDRTPIPSPLLSIQSETFHWRKNIASLREIWDPSATLPHAPHAPQNQFALIKGTKHQDVSDILPILPWFARGAAGLGKVEPKRVFGAYDAMIGAFLKATLTGRNAVAELIQVHEVEAGLVLVDEAAFEFLDSTMPPAKL
ncbi:platelet-activating factor acetylhydrolase [Chytriomyces sp. MP71]|nr:platelet-activating factor acetylhydrolase [Chytriomyces sp. MP71]